MKILLLSEDALRLEPTEGPMTIEALSDELMYSPFHMLASALAFCSFSVLHAWAEHARIGTLGLAVEVHWTFADDPHRVDHMHMQFTWPELPPSRRQAAERAAELCTIHATLMHPPEIQVEVVETPTTKELPAGEER